MRENVPGLRTSPSVVEVDVEVQVFGGEERPPRSVNWKGPWIVPTGAVDGSRCQYEKMAQ
jgi:hypothetical protein